MGKYGYSDEREEFLMAKALYIAINMYDLYPDDIRPEADRTDMARILRERFPRYAQLFEAERTYFQAC